MRGKYVLLEYTSGEDKGLRFWSTSTSSDGVPNLTRAVAYFDDPNDGPTLITPREGRN